jgi:hypothetical protein
MDSVAAFFDDSGELDPGSGRNFVCLGMVVLPVDNIRTVSNNWNSLIANHLRLNANALAINGIEAKSSELYELNRRLKSGKALTGLQIPLYRWGLNTPQKVNDLIEGIWDFLSSPKNGLIYLATVANKQVALRKFKKDDYNQFISANTAIQKNGVKGLRKGLSLYLCDCLFDWLLQRLNYLGNPSELNYKVRMHLLSGMKMR